MTVTSFNAQRSHLLEAIQSIQENRYQISLGSELVLAVQISEQDDELCIFIEDIHYCNGVLLLDIPFVNRFKILK